MVNAAEVEAIGDGNDVADDDAAADADVGMQAIAMEAQCQ